MTTREARIRLIELFYESEFYDDKSPDSAFIRAKVREDKVNSFVKKIYVSYIENKAEVDNYITENSNGWKLERISPVTKSILRLGITELLYTDVPPKVAINESVDIAKKYDDLSSVSFVNGVLNKIAREIGKISNE